MSFVDTNVLVYATAAGAPFHVQARAALARLASSEPIAISHQILREYMAHDANIVATMLAHGETRLLTFNEADFRRFSSVIGIVVP